MQFQKLESADIAQSPYFRRERLNKFIELLIYAPEAIYVAGDNTFNCFKWAFSRFLKRDLPLTPFTCQSLAFAVIFRIESRGDGNNIR
jgi:hypothetical protein